MSDASWSKEQMEKFAVEFCKEWPSGEVYHWKDLTVFFEAGMKKAAEIIEASPTIRGGSSVGEPSVWYVSTQKHPDGWASTHTAKLVNVKPVEKGKSDEEI